jgi:hypothetical protein
MLGDPFYTVGHGNQPVRKLSNEIFRMLERCTNR